MSTIVGTKLASELHGLPRKAVFEGRSVLVADRDNPSLAGSPAPTNKMSGV